MPSRPQSLRHPGLTARQAAFAREFVANGGRRSDAAVAAGYVAASARIEAHRLLQKPAVLDAVRKEAETALHAAVALGQFVLKDLAENAISEAVRLQAAQALLDRGGMQLIKRSEQVVTVNDSRSDAELLAHVQRLAGGLGLVIDGAALVRHRPPSESQIRPGTPQIESTHPFMGSSIPAAKNSEVSVFETADEIFD